MLSSKNNNNQPRSLIRVSTSTSSSSSSSSPPFSQASVSLQSTPTRTTTNRTMEEVWKDINLAPIRSQNLNPTTTTCTNTFRNIILQDFLNTPFGTDPPTNLVSTSSTNSIYGTNSPISSNPTTTLRLNSGHHHFHFLLHQDNNSDPALSSESDHLQINPPNISNVVHSFSNNYPFEALGSSSSSGFPSFGKKRYPDSDHNNNGDRRHKRMIKNRESAARSRARKQAYTNELELEVAHLMEENARLRRQQEQFCQAAAAQLPKKYMTLQRTSTAPF